MKIFYLKIILLLECVINIVVSMKLKKLSGLKVMRTIGSLYNNPAFFLSKSKLEIIENDHNTDVILKNVFPIPIPESTINDLELTCKSDINNINDVISRSQKLKFCKSLANRDGGFFDNLKYDWSSNNMAKRDFYSFCTGGEAISIKTKKRFNFNIVSKKNNGLCSPLDVVLDEVLDCKITGLILEVEDMQENKREQRLSIGAGVIISKLEYEDNFTLGVKGSRIPNESDETYQKGCVVKCTVDEVLKLALATNKRIFIPTELYQAGCVDAHLSKNDDGSLSIWCQEGNVGASAANANANTNTNRDSDSDDSKNESSTSATNIQNYHNLNGAGVQEEEDKAWEIYDPRRFLRMKEAEKRAVLRASGITGRSLPRPREGESKLNELLIELMDEAVRGEVILSGSSQWIDAAMNMKMSAFTSQEELDSFTQMLSFVNTNVDNKSQSNKDNSNDNEFRVDDVAVPMIMSRRQRILREMGVALDNDDVERAEKLREDFIRLTALKADPSQDEGEYSRWMDQDEWYMEQRRKAMGG